MRVKNIIVLVFVFTNCFTNCAIANVGNELHTFFNKMGGVSNVTKSGAYNSQIGGFYTGGGLYARMPVEEYELFHFAPPSINAGCGGIDIFMGAFSHINIDQFIKAGRAIMQNAQGYAFNLALQTYVPQVYNTMQKLNDIAREINNMNINSCEMAADIVGGLWPKNDAASRQICQSIGARRGIMTDYAAARHQCGVDRSSTAGNKDDEYEDQLGDNYNLAWKAIQKFSLANSVGRSNTLQQLFLSVSGTLIAKDRGEDKKKSAPIAYHSLVLDDNFLDMLMYGEARGGKGQMYSCPDKTNDPDCLDMQKVDFTFEKKYALVPMVEEMLRSMASKMRTHSENITDNEKALVELTNIPIMRIIAVQNAYTAGNAVLNVHEFAESIAYDFLLGYLEQILDFVSLNLKELEKVQISGTEINEFKEDLGRVRKLITDKRFAAYQQMYTTISVIQKSNAVEKHLQHMFSSYNEVIK
jgi:conjugative transfer pilus assembly protein TraH